jgi:SAM-dependent methyltransferase
MPAENQLPLPPIELRRLVGPEDVSQFDNPTGKIVLPDIDAMYFKQVFDFGCGCGRLARQLIQQKPRPEKYVGIDLHKGMVNWCRKHLAPYDRNFSFIHHDVYNAGFNPKGKERHLQFPVEDGQFTLAIAWSVFTHILEESAEFYLKEISRILRPNSLFFSTWFLFDKRYFPMMQEFQNALYINPVDPTNAVIFDRLWLLETIHNTGFRVVAVHPPEVRGFQWTLILSNDPMAAEVELGEDHAPFGIVRAPVSANART